MSDTTSLLIPYAASTAEGCQQALQGLALPHLDRLLARLSPHTAQTDTGEETSFTPPHERALANALGLPLDDGRTPWAAWHRHQQGLPTDGEAWAFVTPCQWHVSTDHITLRDPDSLGLDEAASRVLLAIVAPWFAEDGIALHYDQPTRWLASGALFDGLATASLERVLLRDVRPWMPEPRAAQAARTLHRLHSEMQMLLYTHAFNDERAAPASVNIAGVWNGTRSSDGGSAQLQFFFEQTGDVLSGDYHDTSGYEGHMAGTIDGDDIQLVLVLTAGAPGATWTFTGAVNAAGNHIIGHMNTGMGTDDIDATL